MKELINKRKTILVDGLLIFIGICLIYILGSIIYMNQTSKIREAALIANQENLMQLESDVLTNEIENVITDLLFLNKTYIFHNRETHAYIDLQTEWLTFSNLKKKYDQIRFIDTNGNEKIRINYRFEGSVNIEENQLQNKNDRYYIADTKDLLNNQTYISMLDLNMENSLIETPIKPVLRLVTPTFDDDGNRIGTVVINYLADYLLDKFEKTATSNEGSYFFIDSKGNWIVNSQDRSKEWSFMYDNKKEISFKNEFPVEWEIISQNQKGYIKTKNGFFIYQNIIEQLADENGNKQTDGNSLILGDGNWTGISYIAKEDAKQLNIYFSMTTIIEHILENNKGIFFAFLIISGFSAVLIAIGKIAQEKIKYYSEIDEMTGAYNRRTGYEILKKAHQKANETSGKFSICFIDINGLKEVNDTFGHEGGDEMILSIVAGIKKCIRHFDYLVRLGGDEFLIILMDTNQEQAEEIWSRIQDEYITINETENRGYLISASHGIEEYVHHEHIQMDEMLNSADRKMYEEKRLIKGFSKGFSSIRGK